GGHAAPATTAAAAAAAAAAPSVPSASDARTDLVAVRRRGAGTDLAPNA
ncbi:biotin synthase BioB, partial [Streptomyces sp. SID6041]|nr:biotin synthase BioB [Streptomyces sp. SID6041]